MKTLLYCTKAGKKLVRYSKELFEKELDFGDEEDYEGCCDELGLDPNKHYHVGKGFGEKNRLLISGDEGYYMIFDKPLNGTVCAECEIDEVEEIKKEYHSGDNHFTYYTNTLENDELIDKACVEKEAFYRYSPKYALYLNNAKAIEPMPITSISLKNGHLKRAPQNMCYGYLFENGKWVRYLIISIRPEYLCKILNGDKTIEVRRVITKELKELIK